MTNHRPLAAALLAVAAIATPLPMIAPARAQPAPDAAASPKVEAEVRKIDRAQGRLTLKHGPIPNLDMPPMTMVFRVADPRLLDGLKEGDKVRFAAEQVNGLNTVTAIEPLAR